MQEDRAARRLRTRTANVRSGRTAGQNAASEKTQTGPPVLGRPFFFRIYGRNTASSAATIRQARIANAVMMSLRRSSRWLIRRRPSPAVAGWSCIESGVQQAGAEDRAASGGWVIALAVPGGVEGECLEANERTAHNRPHERPALDAA